MTEKVAEWVDLVTQTNADNRPSFPGVPGTREVRFVIFEGASRRLNISPIAWIRREGGKVMSVTVQVQDLDHDLSVSHGMMFGHSFTRKELESDNAYFPEQSVASPDEMWEEEQREMFNDPGFGPFQEVPRTRVDEVMPIEAKSGGNNGQWCSYHI